jgi:diadenosine tetraphosphatase ApaH/serine/threonine PP2A family protein phosphatase
MFLADPDVTGLFFTCFEPFLMSDEDPADSIGFDIPIPSFVSPTIHKLLGEAMLRFQSQSTLVEVSGDVVIVGDLHGNLQDLLRILRSQTLSATYLFLGDYIDRGEFSLEVILFLLTLTCKHPDRFFLLRGNHECRSIASNYGFRDNVLAMYSEALFDHFMEVFDWMPIAAVVNGSVFCVHGGIVPGLQSVNQIVQVERPINLEVPDLTRSMLWADPDTQHPHFSEGRRGRTFEFGPVALKTFLTNNRLRVLVRAHQCVKDGIKFYDSMPVITVFSSSNYDPRRANWAGILIARPGNELQRERFPPLNRTTIRGEASFYTVNREPAADFGRAIFPTLIRPNVSSKLGFSRPVLARASTNILFRLDRRTRRSLSPSATCSQTPVLTAKLGVIDPI